MTYEMYLMHHGIKGQKWGIKHGPPYPLEQHSAGKFSGAKDPKELSSWMKKNISYTGYTTLKSPEQTVKRGKGSCHDQVLLELEELQSMGYNPKATFFLEYTPESSQSGTTHSFVTYEQNGKTYWFENSWGGQEGLHEFNNFDEVKKQIAKLHKEGKTGDSSRFPNLEFSDFGDHKPGESLQELVDKALATEDEEDKKVKHSEESDDFKMTTQYVELSDYLEHHGIKGQKWGVEHGPPYPLKNGVSARIKRAAKSVKNRVEANRKQRAEKKEAKEARRRAKNPTLQDRISAMSDEELRQRTDRLRLENAYKRELPNEKQGESFLRKSSKALNELKAFGDAVSGFVEAGKKVSHAFGLDKLDGDDENPARRSGESLKDYTQRMAQLASLKKSRDTLGTSSSSAGTKGEEKTTSPTYTARKASTSESGQWWKRDNILSDDSRLSSLREKAKNWNVDIDKPVERVWDYSDKGNDWFKESFLSGGKPSSFPIDFTKDDDDEKKKKGG